MSPRGRGARSRRCRRYRGRPGWPGSPAAGSRCGRRRPRRDHAAAARPMGQTRPMGQMGPARPMGQQGSAGRNRRVGPMGPLSRACPAAGCSRAAGPGFRVRGPALRPVLPRRTRAGRAAVDGGSAGAASGRPCEGRCCVLPGAPVGPAVTGLTRVAGERRAGQRVFLRAARGTLRLCPAPPPGRPAAGLLQRPWLGAVLLALLAGPGPAAAAAGGGVRLDRRGKDIRPAFPGRRTRPGRPGAHGSSSPAFWAARAVVASGLSEDRSLQYWSSGTPSTSSALGHGSLS